MSAQRIRISLFPPSCLLFLSSSFFSHLYVHLETLFLPTLFSTTTSPCILLPFHLRGISEMSGSFVEVNVVARVPAGGRCSLGIGSVWEVTGQEWWVQLAPSSGNVWVWVVIMLLLCPDFLSVTLLSLYSFLLALTWHYVSQITCSAKCSIYYITTIFFKSNI